MCLKFNILHFFSNLCSIEMSKVPNWNDLNYTFFERRAVKPLWTETEFTKNYMKAKQNWSFFGLFFIWMEPQNNVFSSEELSMSHFMAAKEWKHFSSVIKSLLKCVSACNSGAKYSLLAYTTLRLPEAEGSFQSHSLVVLQNGEQRHKNLISRDLKGLCS